MKEALRLMIEYHSASYDKELFDKVINKYDFKFLDHINDIFQDSLIVYKFNQETISEIEILPDAFVLPGKTYSFIRNEDGKYISHLNEVIPDDTFINTEIITITEHPKEHTAKSFLETIYSFFPKIQLLTLLLIPIVLLPAFYTNIFNTRLVYGNDISTFFFISSIFITFHFFDVVIKIIIKNKSIDKIEHYASKIERYFSLLLPYFDQKAIITSVRTIESCKKTIWDCVPAVLHDFSVFVLLSIVMFFLLGSGAALLVIFYLIFGCFFTLYRYKVYKAQIENETVQQDLLIERISTYRNNKQFLYLDPSFFVSKAQQVFKKCTDVDREIIALNYKWDELVRAFTFCATIFLFSLIFVESKNDPSLFVVLIALLLINSRLSSALISLVSKGFHILSSSYHIKKSANSLFENIDERVFKQGFTINRIDSIRLASFAIKTDERSLIKPTNLTFKRGFVYGIGGDVGSGKSIFLKGIFRSFKEYSGTILINEKYNIDDLEASEIHKKVAFLDLNSDFVSGSLFYNFAVRGHKDKEYIIGAIKRIFTDNVIDYEFVYEKDAMSIPVSTGQKRKLLIAMALSPFKDVYIFDEVLSNVTPFDISQILLEIMQTAKKPLIIIVSHDSKILSMANIQYTMKEGQIKSNSNTVIKVN